MTRPTSFRVSRPVGWATTGGDPSLPPGQPVVDCCDDDAELPDRALDQSVFIGVQGGTGAIIQSKAATGVSTLTYDTDPEAGNLLIAVLSERSTAGGPRIDPAGWTQVDDFAIISGSLCTMWYMLAPGGPVTVTVSGPTNSRRMAIAELDGQGTLVDSATLALQSAASTHPVGPVTLGASGVVVGYVGGYDTGGGRHTTFIEDPDFATIDLGYVITDSAPSHVVGVSGESAGSYTYEPTSDQAAFGGAQWGGIAAAFEGGNAWIGAGPNITDGDDATYYEVTGPNVARIWLGAPFDIGRVRLFIGTEFAGAKSYTLKGANAADFSDAVTIATIDWTATGSFTGDSVVETWESLDAYEFWELTGDDETRYLYSFELYESAVSFSTPSLDDVLAISGGEDIADALTGANAPDAGNPFATMADVPAAGAPTGADYLVGTANGSLSAEIVVGTTPGGELGGTWSSPTVDATHSGSAHVLLSSSTPLVESGSGSAGAGTTSSRADHVHPAAAPTGLGPLLIDSVHSTPLVFGDILQASDGSDFLYGSAP